MHSLRVVEDIPLENGGVFAPRTPFTKSWRVENNGDERWGAGTVLVHVNGNSLKSPLEVPLPPLEPGEQTDITLRMIAPVISGSHRSNWRARNAFRQAFGPGLSVSITVPRPQPE
jgi:hypothetical protein